MIDFKSTLSIALKSLEVNKMRSALTSLGIIIGVGAVIAMLASLFIDSVITQACIFTVSSIILIFATKPFVEKITKNDITVKTNVRSIEGKVGKVTHTIEPLDNKGQVKVNGESWSAKSSDDSVIEKGTEVIIVRVEGVKAIVEPYKENK